MKSHKIGIVGAGAITSLVHLPVLLAYNKTDVAWLADVSQASLDRTTRSFDVKTELIAGGKYDFPEVDIVLAATPVFARRELLEHYGTRGVPVLCEKPFALTAAEHRSYLEIDGSNRFYCGYMRRAYASIRLLKLK